MANNNDYPLLKYSALFDEAAGEWELCSEHHREYLVVTGHRDKDCPACWEIACAAAVNARRSRNGETLDSADDAQYIDPIPADAPQPVCGLTCAQRVISVLSLLALLGMAIVMALANGNERRELERQTREMERITGVAK